jgi:hypothetical protein
MKPILWRASIYLLTIAFAAIPASGSEVYVASAISNGDATYMALNPDGTFSDQEDMQLSLPLLVARRSSGNGIGDFDNDGDLDYIAAYGMGGGDIYIFPKSGPGNQFDGPVLVGTWSYGAFPGDMAVADFNGDGNLDFVLNYYLSPHCGLYLGDGDLGFKFILLADTTPLSSMSVDAADFDNDGIADFIIAPNSNSPFRVYLGNGDGTFDQVLSDRSPSVSKALGIAAGDFVKDPDGFVDLAVSSPNSLEIYTGNGDGTFDLFDTYDLPMNSSPLDNGDFDRDGNQDLVAADYGADHAGVAVLLGDGNGQFIHSNTYLGGNAGFRKAVTALPYLLNKEPVAILTPETISVTVGQTVKWNASDSYDEDGTIVSYEWDFGDGIVASPGMNAQFKTDNNSGDTEPDYVYYDTGTYYVTLTVTDDKGATDSI